MASSSIIQSSSSSSRGMMIRKYDVFVSFNGQDTRNNFTDHLFAALNRKGILPFRDDTKLEKGEPILSNLIQAIEGSQIFVIVFSKSYASSTWCLRELENILRCVKLSKGKHVLPIFYDVDPSDVRKHSGDYDKALATHEEKFKEDSEKMEEVKRWRGALTQVANLCGWDMRNKSQRAEIEKIVQEIISKLGHDFSSFSNDLVGIESPLEELENLLRLEAVNDVHTIGICGMGGVGKTTLASVLYHKICHQYDAHCFIDVSKTYTKRDPTGVVKQLLRRTLNEENLHICNLYEAADLVRRRLRYVKTLIVLDNVDQVGLHEELVVKCEWLGEGSRIIITSRDQHALTEFGVDEVYKVQLLNDANAQKLFCKKAFKCDDIVGDYEELVSDVLKYANRLPLAVKVLGSFLCGRSVSEWRSAIVRMKENPNKDILEVLHISYDGLQDSEKQIFLDIACFFDEWDEPSVKKILDSCGFHSEIGIRVLLDKLLIEIDRYGLINMHDLLKDLGRKLVKGNSTEEPEKWSRLWLEEDIYNVTSKALEITNTEAIVFPQVRYDEEIRTCDAQGLSKMSNLRLLIIYDMKFTGSLNCLSNKLQCLHWWNYPFSYLPSSFQPNKLVELNLSYGKIKQLWKGTKYLPNLRALNLRYAKNLIKVPDLGGVPNLEKIILLGCTKLTWIHPSVGVLRKLVYLNVRNCKNLGSLPSNILGQSSLEYLNISGCSKLFSEQLLEKQKHEEHSKMPDIRETAMQSQSGTSSIFKRLMLLPFLSTRSKNSGGCLLPSLPSFFCLLELDLSFCNLSQIPDAIGSMHSLETLNLAGNNFVILPSSINKLSKLLCLHLEHCKQLRYLPEMPSPTSLPVRPRSWYRKGLLSFNCPKIVDIERCHGMTFAWLLQILQVSQESATRIDSIHIVIPGNQIPGWFMNQSVGTSINLDPTSIMFDSSNWVGIACSVVFVSFNGSTASMFAGMPCVYINFNLCGNLRIPVSMDKDLITVKSHHLWLLYLSREEFFSWAKIEKMLDLHSMKMVAHVVESRHLGLRVTSCGYRWVFKEDLKNLNPTIMRTGYNNIQVDDDFLKGSSVLSLEAGK